MFGPIGLKETKQLANVFATRVGAMPMPGTHHASYVTLFSGGVSFAHTSRLSVRFSALDVMLLFTIRVILITRMSLFYVFHSFRLSPCVPLTCILPGKDGFLSKGILGGAQVGGTGSYKPPFKNVEIVYINIKASLFEVKKRYASHRHRG